MKAHLVHVWPLVAAAALLVCVDTTVTTKLTLAGTQKVEQDVSSKRLLRVSKSLDERDEEKTIPGVEMVTDWVRQMLRAALQRMKLFSALDRSWNVTPAEFFEMFEIQHNARLLFDSRISSVEDYILLFNRENSRQETLFSALASSVDEKVLVESIALTKWYDQYQARGKRVEYALVKKWESENVHPLDLLKRLGIEQDMDDLSDLTLISLGTVMMYTRQYNKVESNVKVSLIKWFTEHGDDYSVLHALLWASEDTATMYIAIELMNELVESWVIDKKSIDNVLDILNLTDEGYMVYESKKLVILEEYIELFNEKKTLDDDSLDVVTVLHNHVGDGPLAILLFEEVGLDSMPQQRYSELLTDLFQQWEDADMDPQSVKTMYFRNVDLNLVDEVDHLLSKYRTFYGLETALKMNDIGPRRF